MPCASGLPFGSTTLLYLAVVSSRSWDCVPGCDFHHPVVEFFFKYTYIYNYNKLLFDKVFGHNKKYKTNKFSPGVIK